MIDLHLHTTASDGHLDPADLVAAAVSAGITTLAVTDHDTLGGLEEAAAAASAAGVTFVRGIEITAVEEGRDVHVLGYFLDFPDREFLEFLAEQRADRRRRIRDMVDRLAAAGVSIDIAEIFHDAETVTGGRRDAAIGRPTVARALVKAGYARDVNDAFARYLADGRPAYVPRHGASAEAVVQALGRIGSVASLAHPGKLQRDDLLARLAQSGLQAVEVFHPDHDAADRARYLAVATEFDLVPTGGSDYHGPNTTRASAFGRVGPGATDYARLLTRRRDRLET